MRPGFWHFLREPSAESRLARGVLVLGALLPWSVGAGIKLYLDIRGEPTWSWLYLLHPAIVLAELWATLWFAAPSIALAFVTYLLATRRIRWLGMLNRFENSLIIVICAMAGAAGSVPVFFELFWVFDPIVLFFPMFVTIVYLHYYALGLLAGILAAFLSYGLRRLRAG